MAEQSQFFFYSLICVRWPQNATPISGANFTIRGTIGDPFATVAVQVVADGVTNEVAGLVEENGAFWITNVPLGDDGESLLITATTAPGMDGD